MGAHHLPLRGNQEEIGHLLGLHDPERGLGIVGSGRHEDGLGAEHEKNILIADSPEDFTRCITRIFNDKALREKLGVAARKFVEENFSWENIGQRLNTTIESEVRDA